MKAVLSISEKGNGECSQKTQAVLENREKDIFTYQGWIYSVKVL